MRTAWPLLLCAALVAAGCSPAVTKPADTDPRTKVAEQEEPSEASADSPSLAELYPSLGDEEIAPSPELDEELAAEEEFITAAEESGVFTSGVLDPAKLKASYDIPMEVTPLVEQYVTYFTTRGRKWYGTWLSRSGRYLPMMKQIFRENGLPEDLTYLAMIESGFSPKAWSRAKASGPWQFMKATGGRYGLDDDWWVDERRDPELATRAAAAHLKDLYEEFGDWYLAAAAYNAGSGKINRAIQKYDTRNYWELCAAGRYLKPETKHYVPKLIAAAIIAKHPEQFGFGNVEYLEPLEYETVTVPDATDLRVVAECANADYESVLELNPSLKRFCTPPGANAFEVRVPKGTSGVFAESYAQLPKSKRVTFRRHHVRSGDTLSAIAARYGTGIDAIMRMNGLTSTRRLRVGSDLVIPVPAGNGASPDVAVAKAEGTDRKSSSTPPAASNDGSFKPVRVAKASTYESKEKDEEEVVSRARATQPKNAEKVKVTMAAGDTLWSLSQRYAVSVGDIKRWNGIRNHRAVQAGQTLTLYVSKEKASQTAAIASSAPVTAPARVGSIVTYRVKKGDTVWDIAREHNVDPLDLLKDNGLSRRSTIKPGDVLEIRLVAGTGAAN